MTRDITPIKWIIGAIAFLIIIAGACVLWYRYDTAPYRQEAADAKQLLRQSEIEKSEKSKVVKRAADAPTESRMPTAEKPRTKRGEPAATKDNAPGETQNVAIETPLSENTELVRASPHGFGPYPEVPPDYSGTAAWDLYTDPEDELLVRVRIKLWQQGIKADGVTYERNGLIYPIIKGVRYVEWDVKEYPDGSTKRYVSSSTGHPDDSFGVGDGTVFESDIPGHLTIYTYPDGGIDPYQFLDLPKE